MTTLSARDPAHSLLDFVATLALAVGVMTMAGQIGGTNFSALPSGGLLLAVPAYLAAHVLRVMRLLAILGQRAAGMRAVAGAHLLAAPVAAVLPFKLGEIYRIHRLGRTCGGFWAGLRAVWIERAFDAAVLLPVGAAMMLLHPSASLLPVMLLSLGFVVATLAAIAALTDAVPAMKHYLIRRYTAPWSLTTLRVLHAAAGSLAEARALVAGKFGGLALLTLAIWLLEGLAILLAVPSLSGSVEQAVAGLYAVLAGPSPEQAGALLAWRTLLIGLLIALGAAGLALSRRRI